MQVSSPVIKVDEGKIPKVMQMFVTDKMYNKIYLVYIFTYMYVDIWVPENSSDTFYLILLEKKTRWK